VVYVGIDLHRRTLHVATFDEEGLELLSCRVTNDPEALRAIFAELGGETPGRSRGRVRLGVAGRPARAGRDRAPPRPSAPHEGDSRPQGCIGDELEVVGLVEHVFARPSSRWGQVHHAVLRDLDGNRYRCWSSRPLPIEEDRAYRVSGRVTAHDEHRGELETVLARCRTVPPRAAVAG
jgi:hypothetical protein